MKILVLLFSAVVCWETIESSNPQIGNKLNFLEPNCLRELGTEVGLNASRLVEVTYKGHIKEISDKAGDVAGKGMDLGNNILDLDQVAEDSISYLNKAVRGLEIKDLMRFVARISLQKLCTLNNCCYLP